MKKVYFFAAVAAIVGVTITSCSQDESVEASFCSSLSNQIKFTAVQDRPGHVGTTRGTAITGTNWNSGLVSDMQVWGFYSANVAVATKGIAPGAQYVGSGSNGIFINYAAGAWNYHTPSDVAFWPKANLNFQAVIPSAVDTEITNFTFTPDGTNKTNYLVAELNVPATVENQKDVMFAQAVGEAPRTAGNNLPVQFTFNHALAQVVFSGKLSSSNLSATVEDIKICNIDQKGKVGFKELTEENEDYVIYRNQGGVDLMSRADFTGVSRTYAKFSIGLDEDPTLDGAADVTSAKNLTATTGALMMLPVNRTDDKWNTSAADNVPITAADAGNQVYLAIKCIVKNGDTYMIGTKGTEEDEDDVAETVYIPFVANWEAGKKYTYTLVFGTGSGGYDENGKPLDSMLPITYSLEGVTDWTVTTGTNVEF